MNCFNHYNRSAVGMCKACQKGLCVDCAVELPNGLACQGRCVEVVERDRVVEENQDIISKMFKKQLENRGRGLMIAGSAILGFGAFTLPISFGLAAGLLAFGGLYLLKGKQYFGSAKLLQDPQKVSQRRLQERQYYGTGHKQQQQLLLDSLERDVDDLRQFDEDLERPQDDEY